MKRAGLLRLKVITAMTILFFALSLPSATASTLFDTISSTGTNYGFTLSVVGIEPITIPASATIQSLILKIASGTGSGARIDIYADNAGAPAITSLGALTFNNYSSPNATYTGSVVLPSAGKYWFKFSTTIGFQNYYSMTPVTTGSLTGWSIGRLAESTNSGASFSTRSDNLVYLMTINGSGGILPQASSISLSGNSTATFRQTTILSASLGVAGTDGKATFYANGKKIPGCINQQSIGLAVNCSWKPSSRGTIAIYARIVPSDSGYIPSLSANKYVLVGNRNGNR
jgi:hypothetical protein